MEEKHLNMKKVGIIVLIFVLAILLIFGGILLTHNFSKNSINNKIENNVISNASIPQFTLPLHEESNIYSLLLPQKNENAVQEIKNIYSSDEKQVFLTFDDGPTKEITPLVLDILKEENVPATFFVLGSRVELYPELVKREFEEGHYIANHGYSHSYSSIYSSTQAVIDEYNKTESAIQTAIGIPEYHSYLFRFPGGSSGRSISYIKTRS